MFVPTALLLLLQRATQRHQQQSSKGLNKAPAAKATPALGSNMPHTAATTSSYCTNKSTTYCCCWQHFLSAATQAVPAKACFRVKQPYQRGALEVPPTAAAAAGKASLLAATQAALMERMGKHPTIMHY